MLNLHESDLDQQKIIGKLFNLSIKENLIIITTKIENTYSIEEKIIGHYNLEQKYGKILIDKKYKEYKNLGSMINSIFKIFPNATMNNYKDIIKEYNNSKKEDIIKENNKQIENKKTVIYADEKNNIEITGIMFNYKTSYNYSYTEVKNIEIHKNNNIVYKVDKNITIAKEDNRVINLKQNLDKIYYLVNNIEDMNKLKRMLDKLFIDKSIIFNICFANIKKEIEEKRDIENYRKNKEDIKIIKAEIQQKYKDYILLQDNCNLIIFNKEYSNKYKEHRNFNSNNNKYLIEEINNNIDKYNKQLLCNINLLDVSKENINTLKDILNKNIS